MPLSASTPHFRHISGDLKRRFHACPNTSMLPSRCHGCLAQRQLDGDSKSRAPNVASRRRLWQCTCKVKRGGGGGGGGVVDSADLWGSEIHPDVRTQSYKWENFDDKCHFQYFQMWAAAVFRAFSDVAWTVSSSDQWDCSSFSRIRELSDNVH